MNVKKATNQIGETIDRRSSVRGVMQLLTTMGTLVAIIGGLVYIFNAGAWSQEIESKILATEVRIKTVEDKYKEKCFTIEKQTETNKDHIVGLENSHSIQMQSQSKIETKLETVSEDIKELKTILMQILRNGDDD